ncbi:MAG: hypothetical protein QM522_11020 [Chitinophagaceae bacterium]|nr:hypothetical protein [Chitinophagaceae bacterium]
MQIPVVSGWARLRKVSRVIEHIGMLEEEIRNECAVLLDLVDTKDDLAVEIRRLLEALDG